MIKAIETEYKGHAFRSRLEARWATALDSLGIEYWYEPEGYDLDGVWYLPDFWLPKLQGGIYAEVKPGSPTDAEYQKIRRLAMASDRWVLLLDGPPDFRSYVFYEPVQDVPPAIIYHWAIFWPRENRLFVDPAPHEVKALENMPEYIAAVHHARKARF